MSFNHLRRLRSYLVTFYLYVKSLFNPPENVTDETIRLLDQLDWFSFVFLSSRRGFSQKLDQPISFKTQLFHNLFRLIYCVVLLRIVSLIFIKDHFYRMIAGDLNIENHDYVLFFLALWLTILLILREYVLYIEERGAYVLLKRYIVMQINGFSVDHLSFTQSKVTINKFRFYLTMKMYTGLVKFAHTIVPIVIVLIRLNDPSTFSSSLSLISSCFWCFAEIITVTIIVCGLAVNGINLLIIVVTNYFDLMSLIRLCSSYSKHGGQLSRDFMIKTLTKRATKFSNEFVKLISQFRYCTLLFMIFCAFLSDLFIIMSLIIPIISDSFSYFLTIDAFIMMTNVSTIMFLAADFHSKVNSRDNKRNIQ
ncbi:uncharacterized protein LOC128385731 [Panonychus citri]|uniref:uncharacterized protein LOC128385731 n=1 Tax=Panonychus citri TaxID=50023 RepID=UPI00230818F8|nr:uncharacterized protein LOC128385731 [Panonychus citri]